MCPAHDHFIFVITLLIMFTNFVPLSDPDVGPLVRDVERTSFHFGLFGGNFLCACLVRAQVSAPYVILGSAQELHTCLFRYVASLLLKTLRWLAHVAQPTMILRFISVLVIFLGVLVFKSNQVYLYTAHFENDSGAFTV